MWRTTEAAALGCFQHTDLVLPFLVMPAWTCRRASCRTSHAAKLKAPWLSASFALALCHDVFAATHHMSSCGVVLKWQALDQIYVTPAGRIVFGGLSGASLVGEPAVDGAVGAGTTPLKSRDSAVADMGTEGSAEKKRKREKEGLPPAPPAPVPTPNLPFLHMSAPEIIFGGQASVASTVYTAGIVCAHRVRALLRQVRRRNKCSTCSAPWAAQGGLQELPELALSNHIWPSHRARGQRARRKSLSCAQGVEGDPAQPRSPGAIRAGQLKQRRERQGHGA